MSKTLNILNAVDVILKYIITLDQENTDGELTPRENFLFRRLSLGDSLFLNSIKSNRLSWNGYNLIFSIGFTTKTVDCFFKSAIIIKALCLRRWINDH